MAFLLDVSNLLRKHYMRVEMRLLVLIIILNGS